MKQVIVHHIHARYHEQQIRVRRMEIALIGQNGQQLLAKIPLTIHVNQKQNIIAEYIPVAGRNILQVYVIHRTQ